MDFLAAAAGAIVGVSLSPEVPAVGIIAGLTVKRAWMLLVVAIVASIAITAIMYAIISRRGLESQPAGLVEEILAARFVAILAFAWLARGIKRALKRRQPA